MLQVIKEFRVKEEYFPNPNYVALHVSDQVITEFIQCYDGPEDQPSYHKTKRPQVVTDLFNIQGVAKVSLSPYEINVTKSGALTWEELIPHIKKVVVQTYNKGVDKPVAARRKIIWVPSKRKAK